MMSVSKHWCRYSKPRIIFMCSKCRKKFGSKVCVSSYTYNIKIFKCKIHKLSKRKKNITLSGIVKCTPKTYKTLLTDAISINLIETLSNCPQNLEMFIKWKDKVPIYSLQVSRVSAASIFLMKCELPLNQLSGEGCAVPTCWLSWRKAAHSVSVRSWIIT